MAHGLPVVVLIDAGTASASEIVAGALQDHHRALIMGETQLRQGLGADRRPDRAGSALRLTTARYYTPSGRSVQAGGIEPDIDVPQLSDPDYKDRKVVREADLRRHLLAQAKVEDKLLESRRHARSAVHGHRRGAEEEGHQGLPALLRAEHAEAAGRAGADRRRPAPRQEAALAAHERGGRGLRASRRRLAPATSPG